MLQHTITSDSTEALRLDRNLQTLARRHLVQRLLEVGKLEHVGDHTLGLDLATIKVLHRARETVRLRKRADDLMGTARDKCRIN